VGGDADGSETRPPDRPIEVVDLLRHLAGLSYAFLEANPVDAIYGRAGIGVFGRETRTLEEVTRELAKLPLAFSPGDHWGYSMATDVCGHVIEVAAGQKLSEFLAVVFMTQQVPASQYPLRRELRSVVYGALT
jgi:CubicO group peptidase (beta-lactamase class C family)